MLRPSLPGPEWLGVTDFLGSRRKGDAEAGFAMQSSSNGIDELDDAQAVGSVQGCWPWSGCFGGEGTSEQQRLFLSASVRTSTTTTVGPTALAVPTSCSWRRSENPCLFGRDLVNPIGCSNIPVATSEKWQERVECVGVKKQFVCSDSIGSLVPVSGQQAGAPIKFRCLSGHVGDDKEMASADVGDETETMKNCNLVATLQFDLNCMPYEEKITCSKDNNGYATGNCRTGEGSGIDLMQFVETSIEDTCSSYSLSDSEEAEREEDAQHVNVVAGDSADLRVGHYGIEGPNEREKVPGKKSSLEMALMKYADRSTPYIIDPSLGTEFDCVTEAYDYYNLYSWELGLGIKYGKTKYSESKKYKDKDPAEKYVLSVELRCCCAGVPNKGQKVSGKLGCGAMIRLHRTQDHEYVVFTRDLSLGGPLVAQAAKVYTYKVFGMFCKVKTESEDYFAQEVVPGREYVTEHYNLEKVQRWCKGRYVVKVNEERTMFNCECGMFEHFGLPCCHSLRVMISVGVKSIPEAMIMRRWTRKARLILPAHLAKYGPALPMGGNPFKIQTIALPSKKSSFELGFPPLFRVQAVDHRLQGTMAAPLVMYSLSEDSNGTLSSVGQLGKDDGWLNRQMEENNPAASAVLVISDEDSVVGKDACAGVAGNALGLDENEVGDQVGVGDLEEGSGENDIDAFLDGNQEDTVEETVLEDLDRLSTNQERELVGQAVGDDDEDDACSRPMKKPRM
ncbi:hypothetical protein EJB05_11464, partial [Eragrostis curvula]